MSYPLGYGYLPVVQWIEQETSKLLIKVRFLAGGHRLTLYFSYAVQAKNIHNYAGLAQLVEQLIYTEKVGDSSSSTRT